jgi:flavin-dependent dehydrogenase
MLGFARRMGKLLSRPPARAARGAPAVAGEHAIVIGSGIAGLLSARIAADHFARVTVIDRDALPSGPELRKKIPQAPHSHILGARGHRELCRLFPGLDDDLAAAGAPAFDYLDDCPLYVGGWAERRPSRLKSRLCTRMLLEHAIRERLRRLPTVEIRSGERVEGPIWRDGRLAGVVLGDGRALEADLVIDAAGMASRAQKWLEAAGYGKAPESGIDCRGATISRVFRPPPGERDWVAIFVRLVPGNPRQGAITHIENGLWRVSIGGLGGIYPPRADDRFLEFARQLPSPIIAEHIETAEPVSPVYYFGSSFSRWVHFEEMARFPDGLAVIGDAVFHANAEHAQGMTFCILAATALDDALSEAGALADAPGFSHRLQRRLADLYRPYWHWNNALELDWPGVEPDLAIEPADKVLYAFYRRLRGVAWKDPALLEAAMSVTQAELHPASLFRPELLWRLARVTAQDAAPQVGARAG